MFELVEYFLGPQPQARSKRDPAEERDFGAVIYFLRKVIWTVPDFTVDRYRARLRELHQHIERHGPFVAHASRTLIDAREAR